MSAPTNKMQADAHRPDAAAQSRTHPARIAGRVALGLLLGIALLPALLELAALSGGVSPFKYQGF